uniref:Lebercilin-like n=1 Tax=Stegastes partitus TaxID=144197 RepID=A0A3B5B0A7_9TELE
MESDNVADPNEDNQNHKSVQSRKKESSCSSLQKHHKNLEERRHSDDEKEARSRTRTWHSDRDQDQDQVSDGRRSSASFYSEDYENESPSERSFSPYSRSRTPSPTPHRTQRTPRPLTQQHRRVQRSHSKESTPPKDLDLVTKRMLSARLLKINELRNALAELQQRTDELQKENRILRQLQVRQEKALQRYDDTESEISQLLARHSNETQVLRERLRRTQERERLAERRLKDSEEQLQRSHVTVRRLKKLVEQRELGPRDELSRRLEEEKVQVQEAERRIKELERSAELSSSSFQRQLVAEKKKNLNLQEEIRSLQEELQRLSSKLKEKEKELDTMNIYANRMVKPSGRREADSSSKRKTSSSSSKAVQTEDGVSSSDFPSPPPDVDQYLTLKVRLYVSSGLETDGDGLNVLLTQKDEDSSRRRGHVQEEVDRWNQGALANQQAAEEARRKKEQLLAKMREIDDQNRGAESVTFEELLKEHPSPRPPEQNRQIFSLTESQQPAGLRGRRRTSRSQSSSEDLAFGGYAPSFGLSSSRTSSGFPPPPREDGDSAAGFVLGGDGSDGGAAKDKKSSLMQQLFGLQTSADSRSVVSPPSNGLRPRREAPPSVLQVTQTRPAVRAVASFDEDLEELTL